MRANPGLLSGLNRLWIRFFLLAVYSTMFVRDHSRTVLHDALGIDVDEYDYTVFDITTEISRQVFPLTLDTDAPKFRAGLSRLVEISQAVERSQEAGGLFGPLHRLSLRARGALTFVQLYLHPVKENPLPDDARMLPAW
jgi:magnesium-protoporphyrin IX monomethyl ester (oxidative) cyclase